VGYQTVVQGTTVLSIKLTKATRWLKNILYCSLLFFLHLPLNIGGGFGLIYMNIYIYPNINIYTYT